MKSYCTCLATDTAANIVIVAKIVQRVAAMPEHSQGALVQLISSRKNDIDHHNVKGIIIPGVAHQPNTQYVTSLVSIKNSISCTSTFQPDKKKKS